MDWGPPLPRTVTLFPVVPVDISEVEPLGDADTPSGGDKLPSLPPREADIVEKDR